MFASELFGNLVIVLFDEYEKYQMITNTVRFVNNTGNVIVVLEPIELFIIQEIKPSFKISSIRFVV